MASKIVPHRLHGLKTRCLVPMSFNKVLREIFYKPCFLGKASDRTVAYPKRWINDPINEFRYKTLPADYKFPG